MKAPSYKQIYWSSFTLRLLFWKTNKREMTLPLQNVNPEITVTTNLWKKMFGRKDFARNQNNCFFPRRQQIDCKRAQGTLWNDLNVLYLSMSIT